MWVSVWVSVGECACGLGVHHPHSKLSLLCRARALSHSLKYTHAHTHTSTSQDMAYAKKDLNAKQDILDKLPFSERPSKHAGYAQRGKNKVTSVRDCLSLYTHSWCSDFI